MMKLTLEQLLERDNTRPEKQFILRRVVGGETLEMDFHIRAITPTEREKLLKQCTRNGKFNESEFACATIAESCVLPNFKDAALLDKMKLSSPAKLVERTLFAGEVDQVSEEILKVSGFERGSIVDVDEVKNA